MKKIIAMMMVLLMVFALAACGDSGSGTTTDNKTEAAAPAANDGSDLGIDLTAAGVQKMSDDRASEAKLVEVRDVWLEGKMSFILDTDKKTYGDFAEYIGCNAAEFEYAEEDMERRYTWISDEDETSKFLAVFTEGGDGNWYLYTVGSTNIG